MKTPAKSALLAACLTTALSVQAQVLSDFSSSTGWGSPSTLVGNTGTISISSGAGNYYTPAAPTGTQLSVMQNTAASLSFSSSWSVRVDANYATPSGIFTSGSQQFINLGLMVTPGSATPGVSGGEPTFDGFLVSSDLFSTTANTYNRGFRTSIFSNGSAADGTEGGYNPSITGATFTSVMISYDAASKLLTASFDADTTNGYTYTPLSSQSVNVQNTWGMSGTDTFSLYLFANSGGTRPALTSAPRSLWAEPASTTCPPFPSRPPTPRSLVRSRLASRPGVGASGRRRSESILPILPRRDCGRAFFCRSVRSALSEGLAYERRR